MLRLTSKFITYSTNIRKKPSNLLAGYHFAKRIPWAITDHSLTSWFVYIIDSRSATKLSNPLSHSPACNFRLVKCTWRLPERCEYKSIIQIAQYYSMNRIKNFSHLFWIHILKKTVSINHSFQNLKPFRSWVKKIPKK